MQQLLALQPMREISGELGVRIEHHRPVPRADDGEVKGAQAPQRLEITAQGAWIGRDEDAPFAEHRIACQRLRRRR